MSSAPSLHGISLARAFRASARRTPLKLAILSDERAWTYADLARAGRTLPSPLGALVVAEECDEDAPVATVTEDGQPFVLSQRMLSLRALSCIVEHAAFGREHATLALALPLDTARGLVAATLSLWLGSTLRLVRPGGAGELIALGECDTAWLGPVDFRAGASPVPARFRLAICDGLPPEPLRGELARWLGKGRVTAETGSLRTGRLFRHPGLSEEGQPFVGALCD